MKINCKSIFVSNLNISKIYSVKILWEAVICIGYTTWESGITISIASSPSASFVVGGGGGGDYIIEMK